MLGIYSVFVLMFTVFCMYTDVCEYAQFVYFFHFKIVFNRCLVQRF